SPDVVGEPGPATAPVRSADASIVPSIVMSAVASSASARVPVTRSLAPAAIDTCANLRTQIAGPPVWLTTESQPLPVSIVCVPVAIARSVAPALSHAVGARLGASSTLHTGAAPLPSQPSAHAVLVPTVPSALHATIASP